jgi:hypothetical protein
MGCLFACAMPRTLPQGRGFINTYPDTGQALFNASGGCPSKRPPVSVDLSIQPEVEPGDGGI